MKDFVNPLLSRKPLNLILHIGTNDLAYHDPQYIVNNIINLTTKATQLCIKCAVSNIIKRDSHNLWNKAKECNELLATETGLTLTDNSNITLNHLNGSGLHLNKCGDGALANNFIRYVRNVDNTYGSVN